MLVISWMSGKVMIIYFDSNYVLVKYIVYIERKQFTKICVLNDMNSSFKNIKMLA